MFRRKDLQGASILLLGALLSHLFMHHKPYDFVLTIEHSLCFKRWRWDNHDGQDSKILAVWCCMHAGAGAASQGVQEHKDMEYVR
jgi:hypothetical protein